MTLTPEGMIHWREDLLRAQPQKNHEKYAVWHIEGPYEPVGMSNSRRSLGYYQGRYKDIVNIAVRLPFFVQNNNNQSVSRGTITALNVHDVTEESGQELDVLMEEAKRLQAELLSVTYRLRNPIEAEKTLTSEDP